MRSNSTGVISRISIIVFVCIVAFSGFAAAESFSIIDRDDWNQGTHDSTSADRGGHSGNLGLGYQDSVLGGSSLAAYWRLDGSTSRYGGTVYDYSGNGNHGTTEGAESGYDGVFGTDTFQFTYGNSECTDDCFIRVDDDPSLDFTSSYSVATWAYLDGPIQDDHLFMGHGDYYNPPTLAFGISDDAGYERHIHLEYNEPGSDFDNDENDLYGDTAVPTDEWVHLAYTRDGSQVTFYINGEEAGTDTLTVSDDRNPEGSLKIGDQYQDANDGSATEGWNGRIDELQIFSKTLSPSEVEELYLNGEPYTGTYVTETVDTMDTQSWNDLEVNVASTGVSATFRALDSNGNEVDSQDLGALDSGRNNYSLSVQDSEDAEVVFSGISFNPESSWEITDAIIHYGEGSDQDSDDGSDQDPDQDPDDDPGQNPEDQSPGGCPNNTIYGSDAVRWVSEEEVNENPAAFEPDVQDALDSGEPGFCAGDDDSEFVVHQECQSGFCSTDNSVMGVSDSPDSCVLEGGRLPVEDNDDNQRKVYQPGNSVDLQYDETISCFGGIWYMEWPISFDSSDMSVTLGQEATLPITIINVGDTSQEFEVRISESGSDIEQFVWFNSQTGGESRGRRDKINLTVPAGETETVSLTVYGGKDYTAPKTLEVEALSLDSDIYGNDQINIDIEDASGESTNNVPGLGSLQLITLGLASLLAYWRYI